MHGSRKTFTKWRNYFFERFRRMLNGEPPGNRLREVPDTADTADSSASEGSIELFVVWDAIGDGRVVGVFSSEKIAAEVRKINPCYFRYYRCRLDVPTEYEMDWLDERQKWQLNLVRLKYQRHAKTEE